MKKIILLFLMSVSLISCSSDSESEGNPTEPITPIQSKTIYFSNTFAINQFNVYHLKTNGELKAYDYEDGNWTFTVSEGDIVTVTCKVGEVLLPTINYKVGIDGEMKTLYSSPNTTQYAGFRLMKTVHNEDNITIHL